MSSTISSNRAGLIGEGILTAVGFINHTDEIFLSSDSLLIVTGNTGPHLSISFVGEVVGNYVQPAGQTYNPSIIVHFDDSYGFAFLVGEAVPTDGVSLELNWHSAAGFHYGPQEETSGPGPASNLSFVSATATIDGAQTLTPSSTPLSVKFVFINGLAQRPGVATITGNNINLAANLNIIAGDTLDIQYSF